jgi:hypothetical protein
MYMDISQHLARIFIALISQLSLSLCAIVELSAVDYIYIGHLSI